MNYVAAEYTMFYNQKAENWWKYKVVLENILMLTALNFTNWGSLLLELKKVTSWQRSWTNSKDEK